MSEDNNNLLDLTADIVSAHVSNNSVPASELPALIQAIYGALARPGGGFTAGDGLVEEEPKKPAVSIRASIKPDHIVCLEDGKKLTMLKRYLHTKFQMTPQQYRAKWNLPADYPMVAPNYSDKRRTLAKSIGLGHKPKVAEAPAKAARKPRAPKATART